MNISSNQQESIDEASVLIAIQNYLRQQRTHHRYAINRVRLDNYRQQGERHIGNAANELENINDYFYPLSQPALLYTANNDQTIFNARMIGRPAPVTSEIVQTHVLSKGILFQQNYTYYLADIDGENNISRQIQLIYMIDTQSTRGSLALLEARGLPQDVMTKLINHELRMTR